MISNGKQKKRIRGKMSEGVEIRDSGSILKFKTSINVFDKF